MRRIRQTLLLAGVAFVSFGPRAAAQLIPWIEPPLRGGGDVASVSLPMTTSESPRPAVARRKKVVGQTMEKLPAAAPEELGLVQALSDPPSSVLLSSFGGDAGSGRVLPGTTWEGNVTQNAGSITVGGTANDDNGWGRTGLSLNATGMSFIAITAQRDSGNQAASVFLQFEDRNLRTQVFSVSTSQFAIGVPTTVHIPIGAWTINFGSSDIASWSIGGGGTGGGDSAVSFRLTLDELSFTASAIPEPATYAAILAVVALGCAVRRRRRGARAE
jgi:hypothetical protein